MNPNRFAVVLAAQFEHHSGGVRALANGFQRLAQSALGVWRVGYERFSVSARDFLRLDAENPHCGAVHADESGVNALMHVRNRGFVKQIAEALVAFILPAFQIFKRPLALQFHRSPRGESFHYRQRQRIRRHRFVIERDKMTNDTPIRSP